MKLKTHPHRSDLLTLTKSDLNRIAAGETLQVSALVISLEDEPKPDLVYYGVFSTMQTRAQPFELDSCFTKFQDEGDQIKITFDGETGKIKSAEVL